MSSRYCDEAGRSSSYRHWGAVHLDKSSTFCILYTLQKYGYVLREFGTKNIGLLWDIGISGMDTPIFFGGPFSQKPLPEGSSKPLSNGMWN